MNKILLALAISLSTQSVFAVNLKCMIGSTRCIKSQGTEIPSSQAIDMSDSCDDFTRNDIGRVVLRMSIQKILEVSRSNITHPIYKAYYAFDSLHDSPLKFDRKSNAEDTDYNQIKRSCNQLNHDFYDDSKWTK